MNNIEITPTKIDELWGGIGETVKEANGIKIVRNNNNVVTLYAADGSYDVFDAGTGEDGEAYFKCTSYDQDGQWNGAEDTDGFEDEHAALVAAHESALAGFDGMAY